VVSARAGKRPAVKDFTEWVGRFISSSFFFGIARGCMMDWMSVGDRPRSLGVVGNAQRNVWVE